MTIDQLRRVHETRPFAPFTLHLAEGRSLRVKHPEALWIPPSASRTAWVETGPDESEFVDVLLVTSIRLGPARSNGNGRSKPRRPRE